MILDSRRVKKRMSKNNSQTLDDFYTMLHACNLKHLKKQWFFKRLSSFTRRSFYSGSNLTHSCSKSFLKPTVHPSLPLLHGISSLQLFAGWNGDSAPASSFLSRVIVHFVCIILHAFAHYSNRNHCVAAAAHLFVWIALKHAVSIKIMHSLATWALKMNIYLH